MLQILPTNLSNLIAAGEVVSRPASVVKELLENAIDAGGQNISVIILDSGRTLIQVIDDGCGMTPQEAQLCFERHATSKISTQEDLEKISTFGFRGEALASIAAVAETSLKTRREEDEVGCLVEVADSKIINTQAVATPKGSNFAIRNIFYNIPARRKFLKSDASELKHIITEFIKIAIIHHNLSLKLTSNGKDIYNLRAVANRKMRLHSLFGGDATRELVEVKTDTSAIKINGYIGRPEDARKTLGGQYLFVNGRYFRSPYLHKAICRQYEKLIPEGFTPIYYLFLEVPFERVDVNIHPAKTEVKFENEVVIYEILSAAVRETIGKNALMPSIDFDTDGAIELPHLTKSNYGYTAPPKIDYDPLFNPFNDSTSAPLDFPTVDHNQSYGRLFEEHQIHTNLIVVKNKYIITPVKSGILVINITRARERIFFERYMKTIVEGGTPLCQQIAFPISLQLQPNDFLNFSDASEAISNLGFDIRPLGDNSIAIYGVPEGFSIGKEEANASIDTLLASLKEEDPLCDNKTKYAKSLAKSAAAGHKTPLSTNGAQILVEELFSCSEPQISPEGEKCMTIITAEEIDKKL